MTGILVLDGDHVHRFVYGGADGRPAPLLDLTAEVEARLDAAVGISVPWVADVRSVDAPLPLTAVPRGSPPGTFAPHAIRDRSYELSVALWRASRWMGLPVPTDLWASACVGDDGALGPVLGLPKKAAAVPPGATLVVWAGQAGEARRAGITVIAVTTLAGAIDALWPTPVFPPLAADVADAAWTYTLRRRGRRPWRAIAAGIERLAAAHPKDELTVAARVARRHGGEAVPLEDCADLMARLPLAVRLECGAHLLQGLADGGTEGWEPVAEGWAGLVAPATDLFPPHLFVMGALGRLYASWRRYDRAVAWLDRAIAGWFALHEPGEAAHALCERLRVEAILCASAPGRPLDHSLLTRAIESLRDQPQPEWLRRAMYRAAHAAGHARLRSTLLLEDPELVRGWRWDPEVARTGTPEEQGLARLAEDPDDGAAHATLAEHSGSEVDYRRLRACVLPGERLGTVLAREWRY
ncbi:MAG: hypothetical protein V4850_09535 [Myxococcota bacterium]